MKKLLLLLAPAVLVLSSCDLFNNHGKKVTIEKSGVFYKDGATEAEAKALGDYLLEIGYFDDKTEKSAQLTKENDQHIVRLVVDEKKLSETENATTAFWIMQLGISQQVFDKEPIQLVLADEQMKDLQKIDPIAEFKPNKSATIYYNSDSFKKNDAKSLAAVFEEQGFFAYEGEKTILMTKDENTNVVRMVVDKKTLGENVDAFVPVYQLLLYKLKTDAFKNKKTAMYLTASDDFADFKKVPVPTEDEVAQIMEQLNQTETGTTTETTTDGTTGTTGVENTSEPASDTTDGL